MGALPAFASGANRSTRPRPRRPVLPITASRGEGAAMTGWARRLDPVLLCLFSLAAVANAGFVANRASFPAQVITCWLINACGHLMFAVVAFECRRTEAEASLRRLYTGGTAAGAGLFLGDLFQLATVLPDPTPAAVMGGLPQTIAGVIGIAALLYGLIRLPLNSTTPGAAEQTRMRLDLATVLAGIAT